MNRIISNEAWTRLAKQLDAEVAALCAVAEVESAGDGFLQEPSILPKVLFEGHVFHRLTQGSFDATHPQLSYPTWDRKKYSGSLAGEWDRLKAACVLDRTAALQSASWGMFQIMGFNYDACGCADVDSFVVAQRAGVDQQLALFAAFIARAPFIDALRKLDWAGFAKAYNGSAYRANAYDTKLRDAYRRFSAAPATAAGAARRPAKKAPRKTAATKRSALPPGRASFAAVESQRQPLRRSPVKPDSVDLRDWLYRPSIAISPLAQILPTDPRPIKDQQQSNACTGFALATVVEILLARGQRPAEQISGYMLYSMARRYDEWSDNDEADAGSSLRGALKGWSRHGASLARLWKTKRMPPATNDPDTDWWLDAVKRPLGTYYRIVPKALGDIHVALAEAGVVYASAMVHDGWSALVNGAADAPPTSIAQLPKIKPARGTAGHAFAIVGYCEAGFVVQNSWGLHWGHGGFAILAYEDWLQNAMDCWVVQLGVVTCEHELVAQDSTLRTKAAGQPVMLASDDKLADHQIAPFVIDMENNGELSQRGRFRTNPGDLVDLLDFHLGKVACKEWGLGPQDTVDIAIYAHGGLVDENAAAETARSWIPLLRSNRIFPIFLMWETGALQTLMDMLDDFAKKQDEAANDTAGGWWDRFTAAVGDWKNERIESFARWPGGKLWGEMKKNADAMSSTQQSGVVQLFKLFVQREKSLPKVRLHLVGHSAGSIVHCYLGKRAAAQGLTIESLSFMAPAATIDLFDTSLGGLVADSKRPIRTLIANLTSAAELSHPTCGPYGHSLLYLVSRSLEGGQDVPILGMEKFLVPAVVTQPWGAQVDRLASPGGFVAPAAAATKATTHGGMDDDSAVQAAVIQHIRGPGWSGPVVRPANT
ncbi:MAG: N-acetylmuramidase domain-containing protein [Dokdonella sp.]